MAAALGSQFSDIASGRRARRDDLEVRYVVDTAQPRTEAHQAERVTAPRRPAGGRTREMAPAV